MLVINVFAHVLPDCVDAFIAATFANAQASRNEPGVRAFDVIQREDDATRFLLVEVYRTPDDHARHRETAHYATWRDTVEPMMAEPRRAERYHTLDE